MTSTTHWVKQEEVKVMQYLCDLKGDIYPSILPLHAAGKGAIDDKKTRGKHQVQ